MTFKTETGPRVMCAGNSCPGRENCLRYIKRDHSRWASFDVERKYFGGECPHRLVAAKGRAAA